ncbi:cytochrome P450 9e2-like isoform X2 [Phymastichus coffea]|uniref:cytochrome P450 9e2-like isoform X2 n=1 Tax=Phymastichus coffea TaxID=108790 RepID=UPI00273BBF75|nr:cytochrome P450 9e2-like isoform X2 [Phymastichus coffea]
MIQFLTLVSFALGVGLLYAGYIIFHQFTYWKRRKMLHLTPTPLFGNTAPLFFRTNAFSTHFQKLYNNFPGARYFGAFDNKTPAILIKDPDLVREICIKNFDSFSDHDAFITEDMDPVIFRNLFNLEGEYWRRMRNLLTPSFTASRMKLMFELIAECSNDFVQYFLDNPEVASSFDAKDAFSRYTATSFKLIDFIRFQLMIIFPKLMRWAGFTFLPNATDRFLKNIITETVKVRQEKGIVRQDMIHLLMLAMDKKDNSQKVTIDDIIGQAFFFFLAGFDASSSAMSFLCHQLAANPDVQNKLREAIIYQVNKDNGKISYNSLVQIKYLDMVINETLRMYPSAPFTNRVCVKEYDFSPPMEGYPNLHVEKGTQIFLPIYAYHRDPKYFPCPDKFDPERFSESNKSSINPYMYQPFGIGPRQCIGNRFALMVVKIGITDILRFTIQFTEKSRHPIDDYDTTSFPMNRKNGFWLKFEELKKSN